MNDQCESFIEDCPYENHTEPKNYLKAQNYRVKLNIKIKHLHIYYNLIVNIL